MTCGVTCGAKRPPAGGGTPLLTTQGRAWRRGSADGRLPASSSAHRSEPRLASRRVTPTGGGLRAASRPRAASGGPGAHAEKREPTHALADAEQAPHASHHLFLQDGAQACPRDGAVRQSVGVGATHLNHDQHLCDTFLERSVTNSCAIPCHHLAEKSVR